MRLRAMCLALLLACGVGAQSPDRRSPAIPRLPDGKPNLAAPVSRTSEGKPDLSGIWAVECGIYGRDGCFSRSLFFDTAKDLKPEDVQMTPWAAGIARQRESRDHVDDPLGYCLPAGVPRIDYGGGPFKFLQAPGLTAILYESLAGMIFRQVFTDGRALPEAPDPTWLGTSIGHWDGDTFVIETNGLRDRGWIDTKKGRPNSDALRVTERFHRIDFGHMDLAVTIDDPKAYLKPWTFHANVNLQPDTELIESFCEDHAKTMEHRDVTPAPQEPPSPPAAR